MWTKWSQRSPGRPLTCGRVTITLGSLARRWLASLLADFGDACRAAGDLPTAAGAWQQALKILDDLGLPDNLGVRARLEQAGPPSPPGWSSATYAVIPPQIGRLDNNEPAHT
jgi:hypothetical protein